MTWRYQPVFVSHDTGETTFSMCEVYFDDDGKLQYWTMEPAMTPYGDDIDDLRGTLKHMLSDATRFAPVAFARLKAGMMFEEKDADSRGPNSEIP